MLKAEVADFTDPRKSVYRPIRVATVDKGETWECVSINIPLVKVVKFFIIFDLARSILDASLMLVLMLFVSDIEYDDIALYLVNHTSSANDDGQYEQKFVSKTKKEHERYFKQTKGTLCTLMAITSVIVAFEIPLAAFLFKALRKQDKTNLIIWKQVSIVFIFFNFIAFTAIFVYAGKAHLILDSDTWVTDAGVDMWVLVYFLVLRVSIFDLTKGCEILVVNEYCKELIRTSIKKASLPEQGEEAT